MIETLKFKYDEHCNMVSDINEHLPVLVEYGRECSHITEMGVRWGSSTWALIYSQPKKMISYDVLRTKEINEIIDFVKDNKLNFEFIQSDVLSVEIEPTELLFIDTLHTYNQLIQELKLHSIKVSKYIILHDTESFAYTDEFIYEHASNIVKESKIENQGLIPAINDFLSSEIGKEWEIFKKFTNNNGLTILKRKFQ
jgi:hypothetical protein